MRHVSEISRKGVAPAQFEPYLQFVGLLSASIALLERVLRLFGINSLAKPEDGA